MMVKPASSITREAAITCAGVAPAFSTATYGVEGCVGRRVQRAIERRRVLADGEAAQHLAAVIEEMRGDLGHHHVAGLHLPIRRKLPRHCQIRIVHRGGADEMDAGAAAVADIGALDGVAELALVHARPDGIAQAPPCRRR